MRLLFLQDHRETDRFFSTSGVQSAQTHPGAVIPHGTTARAGTCGKRAVNVRFFFLVFFFTDKHRKIEMSVQEKRGF